MKYSVSIHNGNKSNRGHNTRAKESIYNQKHIDKNGTIIILKDEPIQVSYEKLFGEAVKQYNEAQTRNDRKIKNYLQKINENREAKSTANPIYEVIVQVGNYENQLSNEELNTQILKDYITQWEERNPNLYISGAVIHQDETTIHAHISYIPIAHYEKGLKVRNGLNKALNEQGYKDDTYSNTPQMQWQKSEQEALMQICLQYGIETENKKTAKREHYTTEEYKLIKQNEILQEKQKELYEINKTLTNENQELKEQNKRIYEAYQNFTKNIKPEINNIENILQEIDTNIKRKESRILLNEAKEKREELEKISKQLKPTEHKKESWGLDL